MTERRPPAEAGEALDRALRDLGADLAYPPTPDLARRVRGRLAAGPAGPRRFWAVPRPAPRRFALAALLLLLLGAALAALAPGVRTAVADRLGVRGIAITYATPAPAATPAPVGTAYSLGQPLSLAEARARVSFPILLPSLPDLGAPDEVYVGEPPAGGQVALVYRARPGLPPAAETGPGLLLTQFRGGVEPAFVKKFIEPGTRLEGVSVAGAQGYWIEGRPHLFTYRDAGGRVGEERIRLAGNTLLWERGGVTFRLESALSRDEALRIAASLR